jgi:meso-butanediol dehydrogenase / (S,S)-butanediol dehydrogenase / diacetyl reductase
MDGKETPLVTLSGIGQNAGSLRTEQAQWGDRAMDLRDTVAVVTGGARGIGRGIAMALAREGARVAVADLYTPGQTTAGYALSTEQEVAKTVRELKALGVQAIGVPVDVTRADQIQTMVQTVTRDLGPIDILCNNAGIVDVALVVDTTEAQWDAMMDVNVKGIFLCCKAVVPGMIERRRGRIINTASIAGKRGAARLSAYCASKFAVIGFTQSLAHEVARHDITVNAVCPGWLGTAMWMDVLIGPIMERLGKDAQAAFQEHAAANVPLGRPQSPEDVGQAVVYLAKADNVTGVALNVAGGLVMH